MNSGGGAISIANPFSVIRRIMSGNTIGKVPDGLAETCRTRLIPLMICNELDDNEDDRILVPYGR
jgi:hypothetical protein